MSLLTQLSEFLAAHPLTETLLIGETTLQARLWRERLSREGLPWLALRVSSVHGLARDALFAILSAQGKRVADSGTAMERACRDALADSALLAPVRHHAGVHAAFASALRDLAHAQIAVDALLPSDVDLPERLHELHRVAEALREIMDDHSLVGTEDVLTIARDHFSTQPSGSKPLILIPRSAYELLTPLERSVLHAAGSGDPFIPGEAVPDHATDTGIAAASVRFRGAATPAHEFRAALRDIIEYGDRWDDVELVYTDSSRLPELYELCVETELPCTFAEGIPVQYSKAARTLQRFLEWLRDGDPYPLIRLMYEGIPDFTAFSHDGTHANRLPTAVLLREARVGSDVRGVLSRVDRHILRRENEQPGHDALPSLYASRALIEAITLCIPPDRGDGFVGLHELIAGCVRLVRDLCRPAFPGEPQAVDAIANMLEGLAKGPELSETLPHAARRLLSALRGLRMPAVIKAVGGKAEQTQSPLPGHVFVSDLRHAGISGRRKVFLFGMDDKAMPGECPDNPVLTDDDRLRIARRTGTALPLAREHGRRKRAQLFVFLSRCQADVTISCACSDTSQLRELGPSRELLDVFRASTGNAEDGYTELRRTLEPTATELPSALAASMQEWWLQLASSGSGETVQEAMRDWNPMLHSGLHAEAERDSARFTAFDGMIGDLSGPAPILSVSQLEEIAVCPYKHFLRHVLGLYPPRTMRLATGVWLDAAERGTLLHEVLRRFMDILRDNSHGAAEWATLLETTAAAVLADNADAHPPPSEAARKRAERDLAEQCAIFLRGEMEAPTAIPLALELSFPADETLPAPLNAFSGHLRLATPSGEVFLQGKIDRIDSTPDGGLRITDYKTGKTCGTAHSPAARLQSAVYTEAVRRMAPAGTDVRFVYRCISRQGQGRTVEGSTDTDAAAEYIGRLLALRGQGCFPHAPEAGVCGYCDFRHVCGKPPVTAGRSRKKLDNDANVKLDAFRRLHDAQ
jgi:RecB family exonuclease